MHLAEVKVPKLIVVGMALDRVVVASHGSIHIRGKTVRLVGD